MPVNTRTNGDGIDGVPVTERKARIEIYKDATGGYRWRVIASNGRIVSGSTEGYKKKKDCLRSVKLTFNALGFALVNRQELEVVK